MLINYIISIIYFGLIFDLVLTSSIAKQAIVEPRSFNITYLINKIKFVERIERKYEYGYSFKNEHRTIEISGKLDITNGQPKSVSADALGMLVAY